MYKNIYIVERENDNLTRQFSKDHLIIIWNGNDKINNSKEINLLDFIESNSELYKTKYVDFVENLFT